ncbi:MAG TPA: murein transglycosylase [Mycobacteriales bacterium]|nr:murein transglycosylase [Mycobacteriales bacterium]
MRLEVASVVCAGLLGLGAVAATVGVTGSSAGSTVRPTGSPSPSTSDLLMQPPMADFADFQALQDKPAATGPTRRLPRVRLATVTIDGIPPVPLAAYRKAARAEAVTQPGCHLSWWLLAGIGLVESGHARSGGSEHVGWRGVAHPPIYGPVLDGSHGFKAVPDTDAGRLDGDRRWDRAVGPMQFLPSTWRNWSPPGRFDGHADPQDIFAAAGATAGYLCASGSDLSQPHPLALAVYSYNHSFDYVRLVLSVGARYAGKSPDELGVDLLPKDHPKAARHNKHVRRRRGREPARGTARTTATATATAASPSPTPRPTASQSASPSPSPQPLPDPLPTLTPPAVG